MGGEKKKNNALFSFFAFVFSIVSCWCSCQSLSYLWYIKNILAWITDVLFHCRSLRTASLRSAITEPPPKPPIFKMTPGCGIYLSDSSVYFLHDTLSCTMLMESHRWCLCFLNDKLRYCHCSKKNEHRMTMIEWSSNLMYASKWWGRRH